MPDAKWTPGPWAVGFGGQTGRPVTVNPVLRWGAIAKPATAEAEANAHLIAAAPELAEALRGLLAIAGESDGVAGFHLNDDVASWGEFEEVETARAALAKAEGGSDER